MLLILQNIREMISVIREKGLDRSIVTLEFVLELQDLVQVNGKKQIRKPLASDKITVKQYCHILATLEDKEKFMLELVPDKIVKLFWNLRDQQTMKEKLAKGKIGLQDAWSVVTCQAYYCSFLYHK